MLGLPWSINWSHKINYRNLHDQILLNSTKANRKQKFDDNLQKIQRSKIMAQYGYVYCLASRENPTLVRIDWMPRTSTQAFNFEHLTGFINMRESSRGNAGWKILIAKYDVPKPEKAFREILEFMRHVHIQPDMDLYFATEVVLRRYFNRIEGHFYTDDRVA